VNVVFSADFIEDFKTVKLLLAQEHALANRAILFPGGDNNDDNSDSGSDSSSSSSGGGKLLAVDNVEDN
jgi:hypothetical protein